MFQKNLKRIITYFSSPINLQNGQQQILYLSEIVEVSHWIELIFKDVIGQYNLRTIFLHSHRRKQWTDIQGERKKSGLRTKIKSFHSGYSFGLSSRDQRLSILKFPALFLKYFQPNINLQFEDLLVAVFNAFN